ncbi:MAG TPA: PIN domain-containing protein [Nitrososphaerales archaeon]|nr:PIN domain-containing protein [Nitrososphaerales archaeon]
MANSRRDQEYLGIDSNVLLAFLVDEHPDHNKTRLLIGRRNAVNPTVIHETYHAAVFKLKTDPKQTVRLLLDYLDLALTLPIDKRTVRRGLRLAARHRLGGRDALILASYLLSSKVGTFVTFDRSLLALGEVRIGGRELAIASPSTMG